MIVVLLDVAMFGDFCWGVFWIDSCDGWRLFGDGGVVSFGHVWACLGAYTALAVVGISVLTEQSRIEWPQLPVGIVSRHCDISWRLAIYATLNPSRPPLVRRSYCTRSANLAGSYQ